MKWRHLLTQAQQRRLDFSETMGAYRDLTMGILVEPPFFDLVVRLGELLDKSDTDIPAITGVHLDVAYRSQWEVTAAKTRRDCGPTTVGMVGDFHTGKTDVTTDAIMTWITDGADRGTRIIELQRAMEHFYDLTLTRTDGVSFGLLLEFLDAGLPAIVLVHYGDYQMRIDRGYTAGHYLVVCGYDVIEYQGQAVRRVKVHDPDFFKPYLAQGAFMPIVEEHFMAMWAGAKKDKNPAQMALVAHRSE